MSVIEASSVRLNTMADGTLRITCDIEPRHAQDAFRLFGSPGTAMALAALKPSAAAQMPASVSGGCGISPSSTSDAAAPLKGGPLSQDAARICRMPKFQEFVTNGEIRVSEEEAAAYVRSYCGIDSRAELDHDPEAARHFAKLMALYRDAG